MTDAYPPEPDPPGAVSTPLRPGTAPAVDDGLAGRAERAGVATRYLDSTHREVAVSAETVRAVLAAARGPADPAVVARPELPVGGVVQVAGGGTVRVEPADRAPEAVPYGVHRITLDDGRRAPLVAAPHALPDPVGRRAWGWQVQLYQLRSARSWGIGNYRDLATLATAAARHGADLLLVNPLHAVTPVLPIEPSPYAPSSRRFADQLAVAVDALPEYAAADVGLRSRVDALRPVDGERIDRDAVWRAIRAAAELLLPGEPDEPAHAGNPDARPHPRNPDAGRPDARQPHPGNPDTDVEGFAIFCALAEEHGRDWREWPEPLRRPGPAATAAADPHRVLLHGWLQRRAREQLAAAQRAAREGGMAIGVVHDLAVGVDPGGADGWLLAADLAAGTTTGAPPDPFNQLGQDWGTPPLRPDRLADTGYAAIRQVMRSALAYGGGLRVDHVLGLFRLWWIPAGHDPADGTYVRYDAAALLAVLLAEAARTGGVVIGEDLGTVEPKVRAALADAGVLGSAVLWFEREDDGVTPLPPARWRELAAASVSTHDLPTAAGFLTGEQVRIRAEAGQLTSSREDEERRAAAERYAVLGLLRDEGLLREQGQLPDQGLLRSEGLPDTVLAMYRLLARTPCRIVLAAPADAVGDVRQPNLPGTVHEYPNWRLPLADGDGRPVSLERFLAAPGTVRLADLLTAEVGGQSDSDTGK